MGHDETKGLRADAVACEGRQAASVAEPQVSQVQAIPASRVPKPPAERIEELFDRMRRQRHVLRAVLEACAAPMPTEEVRAAVAAVQERYRSIHTLENLLLLLEEAGALEQVDEQGAPYAWDAGAAEPVTVVIDGVECLEPAAPPQVFWHATEEGNAALAADDPLAPVAELFERETLYLPIYKRVLEMCSVEGGASMPDLGKAVDADPLVQKPRFYAAHFVDALEACDALAWAPAWTVTETGLAALDMLADVRDDCA